MYGHTFTHAEGDSKQQQVLDLARKAKILRVHELSEKGNHPEHLRRLYQRGMLVRMGRCEKSSDPRKGLAAASDSNYPHFPPRHLFLKGSPEPADRWRQQERSQLDYYLAERLALNIKPSLADEGFPECLLGRVFAELFGKISRCLLGQRRIPGAGYKITTVISNCR